MFHAGQLLIDEQSIIPWKRRHKCRCYNTNKPAKCHFNLFALSDAFTSWKLGDPWIQIESWSYNHYNEDLHYETLNKNDNKKIKKGTTSKTYTFFVLNMEPYDIFNEDFIFVVRFMSYMMWFVANCTIFTY